MLLACTYVIKTKRNYETPDKGNLVALISLQKRKKLKDKEKKKDVSHLQGDIYFSQFSPGIVISHKSVKSKKDNLSYMCLQTHNEFFLFHLHFKDT